MNNRAGSYTVSEEFYWDCIPEVYFEICGHRPEEDYLKKKFPSLTRYRFSRLHIPMTKRKLIAEGIREKKGFFDFGGKHKYQIYIQKDGDSHVRDIDERERRMIARKIEMSGKSDWYYGRINQYGYKRWSTYFKEKREIAERKRKAEEKKRKKSTT